MAVADCWDCHRGAVLGQGEVTLLWPHRAWAPPSPSPVALRVLLSGSEQTERFWGAPSCLGFSSASSKVPAAAAAPEQPRSFIL